MSSLGTCEAALFPAKLKELSSRGVAIIYSTHRLDEVLGLGPVIDVRSKWARERGHSFFRKLQLYPPDCYLVVLT